MKIATSIVRRTGTSSPILSNSSPSAPFRRIALFVLSAVVSAGLLLFVVTRANLSSYVTIVSQLSTVTIACVVAIIIFQMTVISGCRLKLVLALSGRTLGLLDAARVTWTGFFVEQVGAVFVTGDIARLLLLRRAGIDFRSAIKAPLIDRAIGFLTIVTLVLLGLPRLWSGLSDSEHHVLIVSAACAVLLLLGLGVFAMRHATPQARVGEAARSLLGRARALVVGDEKRYTRRRLLAVMLLAFATHCLNVVAMYLLFRAVGAEIDMITCLLVAPTVLFVSMLPVSISGWGVREGAMLVVLRDLGLPLEQVVSASVLFGLCVLWASLPGALIWLSTPRQQGSV